MGSACFDFKAYLASLCPGEEFSIAVLTGGLVNVTVRATRTSPALETAYPKLRNESSFILKYAPAFIAAMGESAPFSQFRQTIEARALALISCTSPFNDLKTQHEEIRVPRLLFHDEEKYILIIEDLGELQILDKWLDNMEDLSTSTITAVASNLGSFLADLHLCTSPERIAWLQNEFKNENAMEVVFSAAVEPVLEILQEYQIPDAKILYDYVVSEFRAAKTANQGQIFCMGDLWTGSILVAEDGKVGVIDWEFATMGTPSQDMGQLAAHLFNRIIVGGPSKERYKTFAHSMFKTYGEALRAGKAFWLGAEIGKYIRSLWIVFGRELVNTVTWGKQCDCPGKMCYHSIAAVRTGADYVRYAEEGNINAAPDNFLKPLYQGTS